MEKELIVSPQALRLLCAAADGDAALLYLWQMAGDSTVPCPLTAQRREKAVLVLERLGLTTREEKPLRQEVRPEYSETAVRENLRQRQFHALVGEAQRQLGRTLSTEEMKGLLSIHDYLRLPTEVVSILISYCIQRTRDRTGRMPGMRTIEKEAARWVDLNIDTVEAAMQYMHAMQVKRGRRGGICRLLQITDRRLTQSEEQYVDQWIDWGFPNDAIGLAYEKTCLNTGGLRWAYLNSILKSWHEKGLHTVKEIREGDGGRGKNTAKKQPASDLQKEALRKLMEQEG